MRVNCPTRVRQFTRIGVFLFALLLASCYGPHRQDSSLQEALAEAALEGDSLGAELARPYGIGYNLLVDADSLLLLEDRPAHWSEGAVASSDSLWLRRYDAVVVAAFLVIPEDSTDSVWVKVARDQLTMGWLHERELLTCCYPDDPISAFIRAFSMRHALWFWLVIAATAVLVGVRLVRRQRTHVVHLLDIPSAYPTLLLLTLAASALLYGHIQHACPAVWVNFYFHPTLNPLSQPPLLCAFLLSVWLLLLLVIASVDNVVSYLRPLAACIYLFVLAGSAMAVYLIFSWTAATPLGYLLFAAYAAVSLYRYWHLARARYICGSCGAKMRSKGVCPRCGVVNE